MSPISADGDVLCVSTDGNEPVILRLEGREPVKVRLEIDSKCTCRVEDASTNRPGSYTYQLPRTTA
jgi:hypothetical protein